MVDEDPQPDNRASPRYWDRRRLIRRSTLAPELRHALSVLLDYIGSAADTHEPIATLAADMGVTERTGRRILAQLVGLGIVHTVARPPISSRRGIDWSALGRHSRDLTPVSPRPDADDMAHTRDHDAHVTADLTPASGRAVTPASPRHDAHVRDLLLEDHKDLPRENPREAHALFAVDDPPPKPARTRRPAGDPPESVPIPADLADPDFLVAWASWLADRRERRKPLTARAAGMQLRQLAAVGPAAAIDAIETSIAAGWTGLFPARAGARPAVEDTSTRARSLAARLRAAEEAAQHDH